MQKKNEKQVVLRKFENLDGETKRWQWADKCDTRLCG